MDAKSGPLDYPDLAGTPGDTLSSWTFPFSILDFICIHSHVAGHRGFGGCLEFDMTIVLCEVILL